MTEKEIKEQVLEDIKDIIIQSESHFEWQERIGIYKALNILQNKYDIEESDMKFVDLS